MAFYGRKRIRRLRREVKQRAFSPTREVNSHRQDLGQMIKALRRVRFDSAEAADDVTQAILFLRKAEGKLWDAVREV